jgi:uncharacterized protein (DUF2252 family)
VNRCQGAVLSHTDTSSRPHLNAMPTASACSVRQVHSSAAMHTQVAATDAALRQVERTARDERVDRGRSARANVPRSRHKELVLEARPDPIALLEEQAQTRVPELVPVRYGRMLESPFAFFRGAALIMASDLARTPRSGMDAQLCGDAHLANFGMFGTPERNLVFDTNDFDETLPGPWEWDLKRLASSFEIAGRANGFSGSDRQEVVFHAVHSYQEAMNDFASRRNLDVWYARMDVEHAFAEYKKQLPPKGVRRSREAIAKALGRTSEKALEKLTRLVRGEPRIVADPPLVVPIGELFSKADRVKFEGAMKQMFLEYHRCLAANRRMLLEQFRFVEMARKVVGVGSVGTRCWIVLLLGIDEGDPLFLQIKEAQNSVLERFTSHCRYAHQGERVVAGQLAMQASSDMFLGWGRAAEFDGVKRDYYVRQLHDWKGSFPSEEMMPAGMSVYAKMCGWTLARAHGLSGDRVAIAAYLGKSHAFAEAIAAFARAYADLSERDHEALARAVRAGRIAAEAGI